MTIYRRHNAQSKLRRAALAATAAEHDQLFEKAALTSRLAVLNRQTEMRMADETKTPPLPVTNPNDAVEKQNDPRTRGAERTEVAAEAAKVLAAAEAVDAAKAAKDDKPKGVTKAKGDDEERGDDRTAHDRHDKDAKHKK